MLFFPMDFGELTLDGLIDTGAHSSAIPEADPRKTRLLGPQSLVKEGSIFPNNGRKWRLRNPEKYRRTRV